MKYSSKQYAKAFYESLCDKEKEESRDLIKNFVSLVVANGDIKKMDNIIDEFNKIWDKKKGIIEVEISSAKKIDDETLDTLRSYLKEKLKALEIKVNEKQNKFLLGGAVLKYKDKIIDGSIRTRIKNLEADLKN